MTLPQILSRGVVNQVTAVNEANREYLRKDQTITISENRRDQRIMISDDCHLGMVHTATKKENVTNANRMYIRRGQATIIKRGRPSEVDSCGAKKRN